jgi:hypothetical protein
MLSESNLIKTVFEIKSKKKASTVETADAFGTLGVGILLCPHPLLGGMNTTNESRRR